MVPIPEGASAADIRQRLNMQAHPEGGWYVETYREMGEDGVRGAVTCIYYLLEVGDLSAWHRIDATEIWLWHAGAPLALTVSPNGHDAEACHLGPAVMAGQVPQKVIPPGWWQTAESLGHFTLVSCVVAPAFTFDGFEMAPRDWRPRPRVGGNS